ncbi:MAG TPA: DUF72 domain-containing protein [Candidatus Limnocylindria bacterium]|jgi:uncharacterized protein YecE (DUF72 family)|nr:DUF72 domain-containing protein [Candidatus Limnocylindria bacterium]
MTFERETVARGLAELAASGVYIGTSSWKYEGWLGQVYDPDRYQYRGKFSRSRFERECLAEHAEIFKSVCVDAAYYAFPKQAYLEDLVAKVPEDYRFTFKVTDDITVKRFPNLARFGPKAGQMNPFFLDAERFQAEFLGPCEAIREYVGVLIFEFSHFHPSDFRLGREFLAELDSFLAKLPRGWRYGIELRNRKWLQAEYFASLRQHGVAHVYNSWSAMPSVTEQLALPGSETAEFSAARLLLKPGRKFEQAITLFQPYSQTGEVNEEARSAATQLVQKGTKDGARRPTFLYVNNRLEGNSPNTIAAILARVRGKTISPASDEESAG